MYSCSLLPDTSSNLLSLAEAVPAREDGDGDSDSHSTLSADTLPWPGFERVGPEEPEPPRAANCQPDVSDPRVAKRRETLGPETRQPGIESFFPRKESQSACESANARRVAADGSSLTRSKPDWCKCYAPPSSMPKAVVNSLDSMLAWPKHYRKALQESLPDGVLGFLQHKMETSSYSTCFSGVDAPGSVPLPITSSILMSHDTDMSDVVYVFKNPRFLHQRKTGSVTHTSH